MQRNAYLDEIGIPIKKYGTNFIIDEEDGRSDFWKREREKYGFDERECWNLDMTFIEWLYSHLKKYLDDNIVDLTFYKFVVRDTEYTQEQAIIYIIERLERALIAVNSGQDYDTIEVKEAINMWGEIFPACWW